VLPAGLAVCALSLGAPRPAPAQPPAPAASVQGQSPRDIIQRAVDDVLTVLRNPTLRDAAHRPQRIEQIRAIVDRVFDWNAMARSSLGVYWRQLTPAQRQHFVEVFRDVLAAEYVNDFDRFQGDEQVRINTVQDRGGNITVETTVITHSRENVPVNYYMNQGANGWVVHDFSVEGISIVNHYRDSFSRYLVNHTYDQLMQTLETRRRVLTEALHPRAPGAPPEPID
jgi:phospholipid transport system substrate-binding protein